MDSAEQEVTAEEVPEQPGDGQTAEVNSAEKEETKEEGEEQVTVSDQPEVVKGEPIADGEQTGGDEPAPADKVKEAVETNAGDAAEAAGETAADEHEGTTEPAADAAGGEIQEAAGEPADVAPAVSQENTGDPHEATDNKTGDEPEATGENAGNEVQPAADDQEPISAEQQQTENADIAEKQDNAEQGETVGQDEKQEQPAETADQEKAAETGEQEKAVETGEEEKAAETADQEKAAETGEQEKAVETGEEEKAAETGEQEKAAETGEQEKAVETGEQEKAVETGEQEKAVETGEEEKAVETGEQGKAAETGEEEKAAETGEQEKVVETGEEEKAVETGEQEKAVETGEEEKAAETGGQEKAAETGEEEKAAETGGQEKLTEAGEQEKPADEEKQGQISPRMEEKGTPEPSTENMATGTDQPVVGLGPAGKPVAEHHPAPSPVPHYDADATATVKFVLLPTQQVATLRCYLTQTLYELKEHFAQELKIPASSILFMLDGKGTKDGMTLAELGVGPNGTIRLEMQSADPENQPIKAFKPRQEYTMPDVISVRVSSDGGMKDVVVEIERANCKKPFLGGYRHKKTGIEYHHASAQTIQKPRPPPAVKRFCRDTQTVKQKHIQQQTTNDMATQMTKIGVYVNNLSDKVIVPGKYLTADEYRMNTLQKVIVIQKYYRRWLAKRYVDKVRMDQARRLEWERKEELRKKKEKEDRIRREFERRMNPKTKEDFDLLYHALEKWRQEEMNHINETLSGAERKAALCQLLDQETQLIASIGRHKLDASDENRQKAIQAFLDKASSPKRWKGPDGKQTEMDTPYTIRAQELRDIYNSINMKYLTQDERLDVLLTLKHTVKEHDCKLTQEIIELIDREADLLMRGVKESNLEGLRRRISTLFLQYIRTPTFNPEAARLLKVPQDPSTLRNNIYFCPSCNQYLPSTEFQLSSNSRVVGKCRKCNKMDNDARVRQDYSHYRYMLKSIRRAEESYEDDSKIAFLIQENDLRYLVENIWNSQSVLSAWDDLYDLVLVRWERHQEWSPWNSILLTKEEATAHKKLERLEEAYGKVFLHRVKHKHTLARNYFSRMPGMAEHMRSRNGSALPSGPAVSGKAIAPAKA